MSPEKRIACILTVIVLAILVFGAGIFVGICYEGRLGQWSQNIDLSDYISASIIALLALALGFSLKNRAN